MKRLVYIISVFLILAATTPSLSAGDYMYCEGETDEGLSWTGDCWLYSKVWGELEGAETEDGEEVTGECFKYSRKYALVESAETENGDDATGECYFPE